MHKTSAPSETLAIRKVYDGVLTARWLFSWREHQTFVACMQENKDSALPLKLLQPYARALFPLLPVPAVPGPDVSAFASAASSFWSRNSRASDCGTRTADSAVQDTPLDPDPSKHLTVGQQPKVPHKLNLDESQFKM